MAEHDGVVPHIISELLGHKQVVLPMYMATPDHQPSVSSVCKLAKVKTYASCSSLPLPCSGSGDNKERLLEMW
jgi:hypothetical protein